MKTGDRTLALEEEPLLLRAARPTGPTSSITTTATSSPTTWRRASPSTSPRTSPPRSSTRTTTTTSSSRPTIPIGWTKDGLTVLLSDGWDIWSVPVSGGGKGRQPDRQRGQGQDPLPRACGSIPRRRAIDLDQPQYVQRLRRVDEEGRDRPDRKGQAGPGDAPLGRRRLRRPDQGEEGRGLPLHPRHVQGLSRLLRGRRAASGTAGG